MTTWGPPIENGRLTSPYGEMRENGKHMGTDIGPPTPGQRDVPVYSMGPGVVVSTGMSAIRGYWVLVQHDDGTYSRYQHFNSPSTVAVGARVAAGTAVGICGDLGTNVTGVHLHLEVTPAGPNPGDGQDRAIDAEPWALDRGVDLRNLGTLPTNPTSPEEDDMRIALITTTGTSAWAATDGLRKRILAPGEPQILADLGLIDQSQVATAKWIPNARFDALPTVG